MARLFETTLELNIALTKLVEINKGKFVLRERNYSSIILEKVGDEYVEDLGFFHQLSKALRIPYGRCYDAYVERYEELMRVKG